MTKQSLIHFCINLLLIALLSACNLSTNPEVTSDVIPTLPAATLPDNFPTATPDASPAAQAVVPRSAGVDVSVNPEECVDLDSGEILLLGNPECDFTFLPAGDENSINIRFMPYSLGVFAFAEVLWEQPTYEACRASSAFSAQPQAVATGQGYFVCYQTGEGYWGWLQLKGLERPVLTVDWLTFNIQSDVIATVPVLYPQEVATSVPDAVYANGSNQWVRYDQALDLDTGTLKTRFDSGVEFLVATGGYDTNGAVQSVLLKPMDGGGFRFTSLFEQKPSFADCQAQPEFSGEALQVHSVRRYICYQTGRGRLGVLYVHEANPGVGLRIDWETWPRVEPSRVVEPSSAPLPAGGNLAELLSSTAPAGVPVYAPGQKFTQTWQIANIGENTWSSRSVLVFAGGNLMGGSERLPIRFLVDPGKVLKITLNLAAPQAYGTFTGLYWLEDIEGNRFGVGENGALPLQVLINVGEPGLTLAEGEAVQLPPGYCFDLDLGYFALGDDDPACDFSVASAADPLLVQFSSPQAAFDFENLHASPPQSGLCRAGRLSSGERLMGIQDWYVCYKTNQGRYGWLYFREMGEGSVTFDWKTYQ